ncbi:MAG TPA: DUF2341 domain-containing protein [Methanomicrobiales archaeon]|nr:DUF2341 domain-containing protein [Methanomicrobiales archaeon]
MVRPDRGAGLSEAVGFILILAVIVMTLSIYLLYLMPAMGRENEISQMSAVKERFTEYKLNIDTLWTSRECTTDFGPALSLGSGTGNGILDYFPFFVPPKGSAVLALDQRPENITITSDSYVMVSSGGYNESRSLSTTPITVNVNTTPQHFYLNLSTIDLTTDQGIDVDGPGWDVFVNFTPNFYSYNRFSLTLDSHGYVLSTSNWTETVWNSTDITLNTYLGGVPVVSNFPVYRGVNTSTKYTVDLMSPVYGVSSKFQSPANLLLSTNDNAGKLTASYDMRYGYVPLVSGSTQALGSIEFRSNNVFYTPQTYYYQLGGVFLEQQDGSTNEIPPAITFSMVNSSPVVNIGEILVQSGVSGINVSGSGPITITSAVTDIVSTPFISGNNTRWVNISIQAASTNASQMWLSTLTGLAAKGGLPATAYTNGTAGNVAFMNITGGNPQLYNIQLSLTQVNVSADYVEEYTSGGISRAWRNQPGYAPGNALTTGVTATTLTASTTTPTFGDPVVFTAKVTPASGLGTPTGSVTFYDNGVSLGSGALFNGTAIISISTLTVGVHTITATYLGDASYGTSTSGPVTVTVSAIASGHAPWYDCSWHYRKNITIYKGSVVGAQTSFPVLMSFTDSDLQANAQGNGYDILFTDSTGTLKIPHEIETYTSGTGALVAWVKVPTVQSSANTTLYMYFGNPSAGDQEDRTNVWDSGYKAVWHLKETGVGATGEFKDSTSNGNNGQGGYGAGTNPPARVTGRIGYGEEFTSGSNEFIRVPDAASLQISGPLTIEGWMYGYTWSPTETGENYRCMIGRQYGTAGDDSYTTCAFANGANPTTPGSWFTGMTGVSAGSVSTGAWNFLATNYTAGTAYMHVNGAYAGKTSSLSISIDSNPVTIGGEENDATSIPTERFTGILDEIRLSNVARSDTWIKTEYNNENSPSTFEYRNASEYHTC